MEEEKPKKKRKKAPIKREPSSSLEMAEREETRPKVKKTAEESEKEHKKPWQEKYASPEEIETFLNDHIYLRRNVVTLRTEWREPSSYESDGNEKWEPINDWKLNTLWKKMAKEKPVIFDHMKKVGNQLRQLPRLSSVSFLSGTPAAVGPQERLYPGDVAVGLGEGRGGGTDALC